MDYTITTAAERLGVTKQAIFRAVQAGDLPAAPIPEATLRRYAARRSCRRTEVVRSSRSWCGWCGGPISAGQNSCADCAN